MAVTKVLARGFKVEIDTSTTGTATWVPVKGLETIGFKGSDTKADQTDFESAGHAEHTVAERSKEITLEGFWLEDRATGTRDPGQSAVDALADEVGEASLANFQLTTPGGKKWTFKASATTEGPGGGKNENAKWSATLAVSGKVTKAAV